MSFLERHEAGQSTLYTYLRKMLSFIRADASRHTRASATRAVDMTLGRVCWMDFPETSKEWQEMAEKKAKWVGYTDIEVNQEHVNAYADWGKSQDQMHGLLSDLLSEGYKVGVYFDAYADKVSCSVTCNSQDSVNAGYTFTSIGPDWYEAISFALYKHFVVAEQDWGASDKALKGEYR